VNIHFVYIYSHPTTKIPFYVGYGKNKRHLDHIKEARKNTPGKKSHKLNTIKKILKEGLEPIIEIVESGLSKELACELEEFLISEIGRADLGQGPLTNLTCGGDGNRDWTPELRLAVSKRQKNMILAKNPITGERIRVHKDDPRWISGELVGQNYQEVNSNKNGKLDGLFLAKDNDGNKFRIKSDDPRWISGELVGINRNKSAHPNTVAAAKSRRGIKKSKEECQKISKSIKQLKFYYNKELDKVRRFKPGDELPGFILVCGPHKKMTFEEAEQEKRAQKIKKEFKYNENKQTRCENNSKAQKLFWAENPLHGCTDESIKFIVKILEIYESKPPVPEKNSIGRILTYNRSFSIQYSNFFGVSLHSVLSIVSGKKARQLKAISVIFPHTANIIKQILCD
jgi:hypothetical protein